MKLWNLGCMMVSMFSTWTSKPAWPPVTFSHQPRSPSRSGPEKRCRIRSDGLRGPRGIASTSASVGSVPSSYSSNLSRSEAVQPL
eukprot:6994160-Heterocapsa_arctica.AAC.1